MNTYINVHLRITLSNIQYLTKIAQIWSSILDQDDKVSKGELSELATTEEQFESFWRAAVSAVQLHEFIAFDVLPFLLEHLKDAKPEVRADFERRSERERKRHLDGVNGVHGS